MEYILPNHFAVGLKNAHYPVADLGPTSDTKAWVTTYDWVDANELRWPNQEVADLAYAIEYNSAPFGLDDIADVVCEAFGERDEDSWVWVVTVKDGRRYRLTGGCDYTGWDCQSDLTCEVI